jgi:hypothetical protein
VWTDTSTGLLWDCAEPGASEYDPSRDTTVIVYQSLTYYCRTGGATTTSRSTTTTTSTTGTTSTATTATETTTTTTTTTPDPGLPSIILPIPSLTPGALNPKVKQSTIKKTICKSGWTATIRPPVTFTNALKIKQMVLYEETGLPSEYEEDHFIPLELGGGAQEPEEPLARAALAVEAVRPARKQVEAKSLQRPSEAREGASGYPAV